MREIKFRAWDKVEKKMYFSLDGFDDTFDVLNLSSSLDLDRYSLMEFTGLQDVNGNDIYEGDILEFDEKEWGGKKIFLVRYDKYNQFGGAGTLRDWEIFCKIIGNIYENPELLEDNK